MTLWTWLSFINLASSAHDWLQPLFFTNQSKHGWLRFILWHTFMSFFLKNASIWLCNTELKLNPVFDPKFQCHFSYLLLCLTVWHARAATSTHMPCWTLKPCDRHVHLFKQCPDRRKPWPSAFLSEPVHHCQCGSVVQNSSCLSRWSPPDWTRSV